MRRALSLAFLPALAAGTLLLGAPAAGASPQPSSLPIAVSPHGAMTAFVEAGEIWVRHADGTHPRQITSGEGAAFDPAFMPDGRRVVFSRDLDVDRVQLYLVSVQGGVETPIPGAGRWALQAAVSRSGLIAYVGRSGVGSPWQLRTIHAEGGDRRTLLSSRPGTILRSPRFSADGRRIVVGVCRQGRRDRSRCAPVAVRAS